jgi:hypothetical protein
MSTVDPTADAPMAVPTQDPGSRRVAGRLGDIRSLLARRGEERGGSVFDRMDRLLSLAGSVALPLGLVAIFLGWYGAARTPLLFEQIPYLISGGLLGVGLMLGGGMLFFGSWLARMAEQDRRTSQELMIALGDLREAVLTSSVATMAASPTTTGLVATPTGSMAHLPTCSVVAHRGDLVAVQPDDGFKPCKICDPDLA